MRVCVEGAFEVWFEYVIPSRFVGCATVSVISSELLRDWGFGFVSVHDVSA